MALNPPLDDNNDPLRTKAEHFILKRPNVQFEILIDQLGNLKGEGHAVLTTARIVLIK